MHLILALAAGVNGAANGSALLYKRGTTSFATYYTGFDASGAVTPSAAVALDANGGGVFYVNELVDVTVKDSNGTTVRSFTAGDNASAVEALTQSFTGTDYTTGQSGASKPTTLQTILDAWKTSAGALDYKVLVSGVATTLQTAINNSVAAMFFNVKSTTYGATGDGSTDDTTAIAAALTAASAAGGGTVFFPKGTYKITLTLSVPANVSLLGAGSNASSISMASGIPTGILQVTGSGGAWTFIRDLSLTGTVGGAQAISVVGGQTPNIRVDGCYIACLRAGFPGIQAGSGCRFVCTACTFDLSLGIGAATVQAVDYSGAFVEVVGSQFLFPATYTGKAMTCAGNNSHLSLVGNEFKCNTITAGTPTIVDAAGSLGGLVSLVGNVFAIPGSAGIIPYALPASAPLGFGFAESSNLFRETGILYAFPTITSAAQFSDGISLDGRAYRMNGGLNDAGAVTIPCAAFGTFEVARSSVAIQTITFDAPPSAGHLFTLIYSNTNVGVSGTITVAGPVKGLANFTVNGSRVSYYHFRSVQVAAGATHYYWSLVGADVNETP